MVNYNFVKGNDFLPYLGEVIPSLLHSAQLKPDIVSVCLDELSSFAHNLTHF